MNCWNALIILVVVAVAIVGRYVYLQWQNQHDEQRVVDNDIMNRVIVSVGEQRYSWWPISHFILYALLAFLFPDCWLFLFAMGILWELIEYAVSLFAYRKLRDSETYDASKSRGENKQFDKSSVQYAKEWWAGNITDIYFNVAGIIVGLLLAKLIKH